MFASDALPAAIGGATGMGCAVAGLIFLRYWRRTSDRLFAYFAVAFWMMAINRITLAMLGDGHEASAYVYLVRFLAFLLILIGIIEKNARRRV